MCVVLSLCCCRLYQQLGQLMLLAQGIHILRLKNMHASILVQVLTK
jgi:hypothetical protein